MSNSDDVSELSTSGVPTSVRPTLLANGPESRFVVEAIDALLRSDVVAARLALIEGADALGWPAIAHRLDVAGHALAFDAGFCSDRDADNSVLLLPGVDTSQWNAVSAEIASRPARPLGDRCRR